MHPRWWVGSELNGRPRIFSPVRQPCTPPTHISRYKFNYQTHCFCKMRDSNPLPIVYQTNALPYELISLLSCLLYVSWRRGWDSNPHILADDRFSRPEQCQLCLPLHTFIVCFKSRLSSTYTPRHQKVGLRSHATSFASITRFNYTQTINTELFNPASLYQIASVIN